MFLNIFLEKWMPAFITAGIGGLFVAVLVPGIQSHYAEQAAFKERQIVLWESIGDNFTNFINSNFQLVTVAKHIRSEKKYGKVISKAVYVRKEKYLISRDEASSKLNRDLLMASYYYGNEAGTLVNNYTSWLSKHKTATIDTMPTRLEFEAWRDQLLSLIKKQLSSK